MRDPSDADIRGYLLGLTSEADAEALEEEYFARPEVLERMRAVEDDVLDDYAAGRLGPADTVSFEARYLASEPLRQRVYAARALRLAAPAAAGPARLTPRRVARWTGPLAIAAGVAIAIAASWLWRSREAQSVASAPPPSFVSMETPTPGPTASASPSAGASPSAPATSRLVLALSPTLLRGEGGPAQVRIPPAIGAVVLELQGDPSALPSGSRLEASIETVEGVRVWSGAARRISTAGRVASVAVPAEPLAPGDYLATLSADGQTLYRYFFRVTAR